MLGGPASPHSLCFKIRHQQSDPTTLPRHHARQLTLRPRLAFLMWTSLKPPSLLPAGCYICGSEGSGKSLLMDLLSTSTASPKTPSLRPAGCYIYGSVGSGKSLLMDLLYTSVAQPTHHHHPSHAAPEAAAAKDAATSVLSHHRRLHFNSALLELHSRLHELVGS